MEAVGLNPETEAEPLWTGPVRLPAFPFLLSVGSVSEPFFRSGSVGYRLPVQQMPSPTSNDKNNK